MLNKSKTVMLSVLLCLFLLTAACSSGNGNKNNNLEKESTKENSSENGNASSGGDVKISIGKPSDDNYLGRYDQPIEVSTVRGIGSDVKFFKGESIDNNIWTRTIKEQLGIIMKTDWSVNANQYDEKLNISIASGSLPDFFAVNSPTQLKQLVDAGQIMDLTDLYQKHGSPAFKKYIEDTTNGTNTSTFNGKLMALPGGSATSDSAPILWIRRDWLKKLELPEPKSIDDVLKISQAFTTMDPDGNGKNDTYGLALNKTLLLTNGGNAFGSLEGWFNGYHAYPQNWIKDKDGKLIYGSIQPEMKAALLQLQKMYHDGQIDQEFSVKDETKEAELANSGKLGMAYGLMYHPLNPLTDNRKNDPNADWQAYPIASIDSLPANPQTPASAIYNYYVINKDAKNPEAIFKLINLSVIWDNDPSIPQNVWQAHSEQDGIQTWYYFPLTFANPTKNLTIHHKIIAALKSKDTTGMNSEELTAYNKSLALQEGSEDATDWAYDKVFGNEGSYAVIDKYVTEDLILPSAYTGISTDTMTLKSSTLQKMEIETFTNIILGQSIDSFDKFVSDWKKLGGDQITAEVNEAQPE